MKHKLQRLANKVKGMGVNDPRADEILNQLDWDGFWPVAVNEIFTGKICAMNPLTEDGPEDGFSLSADGYYCIPK